MSGFAERRERFTRLARHVLAKARPSTPKQSHGRVLKCIWDEQPGPIGLTPHKAEVLLAELTLQPRIMRALTYHGQNDVRVDTHPDPQIKYPTDIIIKVTSTAICGSDLHLLDGYIPMMKPGDIIGHEPMGEIVAVGSQVKDLQIGDRVVVPFPIACGKCWFCDTDQYSLCDNSHPEPQVPRMQMGHAAAGIYGYSHLTGGIPGGQAELMRVIEAEQNVLKVPEGLSDEQVLFLSDILPTGYQAAENAQISPGDTVAVWGCGPVGQFAIQSAWMLGAGRVIAIDQEEARLKMARTNGRAETIDFSDDSQGTVYDRLMEMTSGRGPDRCIDCVGAEAHAANLVASMVDEARRITHTQTDRGYVLEEMIMSCRKGGTLSIPGVYATLVTMPFGAAMNKGLTFKMGQTHVQRYLVPLLEKIQEGKLDPTFIITHTASLEDAPAMYEKFRAKKDNCVKVVLKP